MLTNLGMVGGLGHGDFEDGQEPMEKPEGDANPASTDNPEEMGNLPATAIWKTNLKGGDFYAWK